MKKLYFILMLCPLMWFTSCSDSSNSGSKASDLELLDKEIEATNAQLPMQIDYVTTFLEVSRSFGVVTYKYEIDENEIDFDDMQAHKVSFRAGLKGNLTSMCVPGSDLYAFLSLMSKAGAVLQYEYKGNLTGKIFTIEFSKDEIQAMLKDN